MYVNYNTKKFETSQHHNKIHSKEPEFESCRTSRLASGLPLSLSLSRLTHSHLVNLNSSHSPRSGVFSQARSK